MASSSSISLSGPPIITSIFKPKPSRQFHIYKSYRTTIYCSHTELAAKAIRFHNPCHGIAQKRSKIWRSNATSVEVLPTESTPLETSQEIVSSAGDESLSSVISVLFFAAFIALSILTIGVIYLLLFFLGEGGGGGGFFSISKSANVLLSYSHAIKVVILGCGVGTNFRVCFGFVGSLHRSDRFLAEEGEGEV